MANTLALKVIKVEGEVFLRHSDGTLEPLQVGDVLSQGDMLVTHDGAVYFEDPSGKILFVPPNSSILVTQESVELSFSLEGSLGEAFQEGMDPAPPLQEEDESLSGVPDSHDKPILGGFGFFHLPRVDYLQDNRFFDLGNLGRDVNEIFNFSGRHTENPRIAYKFDLDKVKFPLYGREVDYPEGSGEDSFKELEQGEDWGIFQPPEDLLPPEISLLEGEPIPTPVPPVSPPPITPPPVTPPPVTPPSPGGGGGGGTGPTPPPPPVFTVANDTNIAVEDGPDAAGLDDTDNNTTIVQGDILVNDTAPDGGTITITEVGVTTPDGANLGNDLSGTYGTVEINGDGTYTYILDNTRGDVQALAVGETLTDTFVCTVEDSHGETKETTLTITIVGTNDVPDITLESGDSASASLTEGGTLTSSGALSVNDVDINDAVTASVLNGVQGVKVTGPGAANLPSELTAADLQGMFTLTDPNVLASGDTTNTNGIKWNFDPGTETFGFLKEGEAITLTYTVQVDDGHGGTDTQEVAITITGKNDLPVAAVDKNQVEENSTDPVAGNLIAGKDGPQGSSEDVKDTDPDGDTLTVVGVVKGTASGNTTDNTGVAGTGVAGEYGTITVNPDGIYSYQVDNSNTHVNALSEGDTLTETFTYTIADGKGGYDHTTVTITINGKNDDPVVQADTNSVTEDTTTSVSSNVITGRIPGEADSDVDAGDALKVTRIVSGTTAGASDNVAAGTDGTNGTDVTGTYGTLKIGADGSYTYNLHNSAEVVQSLGHGESKTETFTYTVTDDQGSLQSTTLTITVGGTNDRPEIQVLGGDVTTGELTETDSGLSVSHTLSIYDVDIGDTVSIAKTPGQTVGTEGTFLSGGGSLPAGLTNDTLLDMFSISGAENSTTEQLAQNGATWTFNSGSEAFNFLPEGETLVLKYKVQATDDSGASNHTSTEETITITITGTNDDSVVQADTNSVTEDTTTSVSSNVITGRIPGEADSDVDAGDTLKVTRIVSGTAAGASDNVAAGTDSTNGTDVTGTYGTLKIGADGSYAYNLHNSAEVVQNLAKGESKTETFTYTVTDGKGNPQSTTLTITVNGTNDQPGISLKTGDSDAASANETADGIALNGALSIEDLDTTDSVEMSVESVANNARAIFGVGAGAPFPVEGWTEAAFNAKLQEMLTFTNDQVLDGSATTQDHAIEWNFNTTLDGTTYPFDFVPAGKDLVLTYTVKATDDSGQGNTSSGGNEVDNHTHTITITIHGTNDTGVLADAMVVSDDEDTPQTGNVFSTDHSGYKPDPDAGESVKVTGFKVDTNHDGTPETFTPGGTATITKDGGAIGTFTMGADGSYTFTPSGNYSGPVPTVTYTASSGSDSAGWEDIGSSTLDIRVKPVSDAPTITVTDKVTPEDTAVGLGLKAPGITDTADKTGAGDHTDNPERLGPISLTIPEGVVLQYGGGGTTIATGASGGSTVKIVLSDGVHIDGAESQFGVILMTKAQYEALEVAPPAHRHENFSVGVSATSYEVDHSGNIMKVDTNGLYSASGTPVSGATTSTSIGVDVKAVTDSVDLKWDSGAVTNITTQDHVHSATIDNTDGKLTVMLDEDSTLNLKGLLTPSFDDTDGSEHRWVEITGLPAGTKVGSQTVGADGKITVEMTDGATELPDITITPPENFSGDMSDFTVTLWGQDRDTDSDGGTPGAPHLAGKVSDSVTVGFQVRPVGGDVAATEVAMVEDTSKVFLDTLALTDTGSSDGEEKITGITIKELPQGWVIKDGGGTIVFTGDGSTEYTVPPNDVTNDAYKSYTATPPAHSSADIHMKVTVTTKDTATVGGNSVSVETAKDVIVPVKVTPVAEEIGKESNGDSTEDLTMNGDFNYTTHAEEDTAFALNVDGFDFKTPWKNQDATVSGTDNSEKTYALLSPQIYKTGTGWVEAAGATFTWSGGSGTYRPGVPVKIPVDALDSVVFQAPPEASGEFKIKVQALTVDTDPDDPSVKSEATSGEAWLKNLIVEPKADEVTLAVDQAKGKEDTEIPLHIRTTSSDSDETFIVTIRDVPAGAVLKYDGSVINAQADGSYKIENFDGTKSLTVQPPLNSNEDFTLDVGAVSVDKVTLSDGTVLENTNPTETTLDLAVKVKGVADTITLNPFTKTMTEGSLDAGGSSTLVNGGNVTRNPGEILIDGLYSLDKTVHDNDGSETSTVIISGLDDDFSVVGGTFLGGTGAGREWLITYEARTSGAARIVAPQNFSGTLDVNLRAVTTEDDGNANNSAATSTAYVTVTPTPEATINLQAETTEDKAVKLDFAMVHQHGDTDEILDSVWIKGSSLNGVTLHVGETGGALAPEGDGWVKVSGVDLQNLWAKGPANTDGTFPLEVKYGITDPSSDNALASTTIQNDATYTLQIAPVTDKTATSLGGFDTSHDANSTVTGTTVTATGETQFSLNVNVTQLADSASTGNKAEADESEKLIRLEIDGIPPGVQVQGGVYSGIGSTNSSGNPTERWIITVPNEAFSGGDASTSTPDSIVKTLTFTLDNNSGLLADPSSRDYDITITALSQDQGGSGNAAANTERSSASYTLTIDPPDGHAGTPYTPATITAVPKPVTGNEDVSLALKDMLDLNMTDQGTDPHPKFTITLKDLPEGTLVEGMIATQDPADPGNVIYTASSQGGQDKVDQLLNSITVKPPENFNTNQGSFPFKAEVTTYTAGGTTNSSGDVTITPTITPVTDVPVITGTPPDIGEGGVVNFTVNLSNPADGAHSTIVDGKMYVQITDSSGNTGGTLSYGGASVSGETVSGVSGLADGTYYVLDVSGDVANGTGSVTLAYTPEEHVSGQYSFAAKVVSQEEGAANTEVGTLHTTFEVAPVNSGYEVSVTASSGTEDAKIPITLGGAGLADTDGSEKVVSVTLSNVPEDYLVYVGDDLAQNVGGKTWAIGLTAEGKVPENIFIKPPEHKSGVAKDLKLTIYSGEEGATPREDTTTFDLEVAPEADGITMKPTKTFGSAGEKIAINLNATMVDTDGSEKVTLTLEGLAMKDPAKDVTFYVDGAAVAATSEGEGEERVYTLSGIAQEDLGKITFSRESGLSKTVTVTAKTVDSAVDAAGETVTDESDVVTGTFGVNVYGPTDDYIPPPPPAPAPPVVGTGGVSGMSFSMGALSQPEEATSGNLAEGNSASPEGPLSEASAEGDVAIPGTEGPVGGEESVSAFSSLLSDSGNLFGTETLEPEHAEKIGTDTPELHVVEIPDPGAAEPNALELQPSVEEGPVPEPSSPEPSGGEEESGPELSTAPEEELSGAEESSELAAPEAEPQAPEAEDPLSGEENSETSGEEAVPEVDPGESINLDNVVSLGGSPDPDPGEAQPELPPGEDVLDTGAESENLPLPGTDTPEVLPADPGPEPLDNLVNVVPPPALVVEEELVEAG